MKAKISILILILLMSFSHKALGTDEVNYMTDGDDDLFMTETGNLFQSTPLISVNEPLVGILSFFRFQDIDVPKDSLINNATLHLWTNNNFEPFDVLWATIYGIDEADCSPFGDTSDLKSRPATEAYVNWNISGVVGEVTEHTIEVTNIVQEITEKFYWVSGNDMGFKILSARGGPERQVTAYEYGAMPRAFLNVTYGEAPPESEKTAIQAQANPPYNDIDIWEWTFWKHYDCGDIWNVTNKITGGTGTDLNWETINYSHPDFNILDSGSDYNQVNDTYLQRTTMRASAIGAYYTDEGATIKTGFFRFNTFVTGVLDTEPGNAPVPGYCGISSATPVAGAGLPYGASGSGAWLIVVTDPGDTQWRYALRIRSGVLDIVGGYSSWYSESTPAYHYVTCWFDSDKHRISYRVYSDPNYQTQIESEDLENAWFTGYYRYPQFAMSMAQAHNSWITDRIHTYSEPYSGGFTYAVVINGTLETPDMTNDPESELDELCTPDPEDPEPPGEQWEISPISRFDLRLYFLIAGLSMLIGPIFFFAWRRPTGQQVVVGCLIMLIGVSFLIHITQI